MSRPRILDEAKRNTILALLSVGCSRRTAAGYVNCDPKTIYNTAERDFDFSERLSRAENASEFKLLARIVKAGNDPKHWRAAAWSLERMFPDRFGVRTPETVTPKQLAEFTSRLMEMLVEEIPVAAYRKKILARLDEFVENDTPIFLTPEKHAGKTRLKKPRNHREKQPLMISSAKLTSKSP
jgi:hypothetical protein